MVILLGASALTPALGAQEFEDAPEMLRLSFFMCDTNRLDEAMPEPSPGSSPCGKSWLR